MIGSHVHQKVRCESGYASDRSYVRRFAHSRNCHALRPARGPSWLTHRSPQEAATFMRGIRPFDASDIPLVTALHCDAFANPQPRSEAAREEYHRWLSTVFLENPMRTPGIGSIVFEEDGQLIGFLGVVPRRLQLNGRTYQASVCSNFCVRPDRRGGVGAQLLSQYRNMPHDVAFVDEVRDRAAALFERCGWNVSGLQSVRWVLPLRPVERLLSTFQYRLPAQFITAGRPVTRALDSMLRRVPRSPFRVEAPELVAKQMASPDLARLIGDFAAPSDLRPVTTDGSTAWLVERARGMTQQGELHLLSVEDARGETVGWCVYYAVTGGQGEVLQLVSTREAAKGVLDALAHHAYVRGTASLSGTLHPTFLPHLAARRAFFDSASGSRWMLVHTQKREIMEAFWRGDLLISRLDGEWFQHLR